MRYEIRVIGSAGQGSLLAAYVLAQAGVEDGYHVTQTATYGAAMRSGTSMGDVVISNEPIDFPKVIDLDAIIIQSQEAYDEMVGGKPVRLDPECGDKNADILVKVKDGAIVVFDADLVKCDLEANRYKLIPAPIARTATEVVGKRQTMNIVALGVLCEALKDSVAPISEEAFVKAIEKAVPSRFVELNKKAFAEGLKIAKEAVK
ncbi:2-oxoacid:acceptor oxidoreductase family protein [Desulfurobacterium atlanticum]|uniref:2-oxoglutarate ferredoxin oxidoreductase, gamma subunit n=1 Tax=Desulfurobacterium atlanticum TaxID=240169 RepID=A0A238XMS6_9BACT|nr:2-oxoacid:acceptor oxidoreductase family protein [Desulfurobacterium atlanticum]SNR59279.1 2-oxoglutarate ferredoxin oxidoreductase, gamma subunit [Desulfurobacterium atlanticum]